MHFISTNTYTRNLVQMILLEISPRHTHQKSKVMHKKCCFKFAIESQSCHSSGILCVNWNSSPLLFE